MKTKFCLALLLLFSFSLLSSQVPQGFNYQAIARDNFNNPILNTAMPVEITVQSDSAGTVILWKELHASVTTNGIGLFNLILGRGARLAGLARFSDIDWSVTPVFVHTRIQYPVPAWKDMGTTRLWSVPYSMSSDFTKIPRLKVQGQPLFNNDSALFEVKNKNGQTVFAVYNEGVRIYVDDGLGKGPTKGGFAIGSFDKTKGVQDYFVVNGDSIRAYIDTNTVKSRKGGFAIGSFDKSKTGIQEYFRVTHDSTRVYLNDTGAKSRKGGFAIGGFDKSKTGNQDFLLVSQDSIRMYINNSAVKALKGGFAIGGFDKTKANPPKYLTVNPNRTNISVNDSLKGFSVTTIQGGTNTDFMNINKINYAIGHESGLKTVPDFSSYMGRYNVFFGYKAGYSNVTGYGNIFVGHETGLNSVGGSYNVYMGYMSGRTNASGSCNLFMGYQSGQSSTGNYDVYLGQGAGQYNGTGERNTYIGGQSGIEDGRYVSNPLYPPGNDNVFIGFRAGAKSWTGNTNTCIGASAGENKFGTGRVFIGYRAGYNETTNNKLYIENSESASPLIWGDFAANKVKIYGDLEYTGTLTGPSDVRLKNNLVVFGDDLRYLLDLNAYYFYWNKGILPGYDFPDSKQIGLIAQEVEKYFPEIVVTGQNGYKSIEYAKIGVLLIPAVKEMYNDLQKKDTEIQNLKSELAALKLLVQSIDEKLGSLSK